MSSLAGQLLQLTGLATAPTAAPAAVQPEVRRAPTPLDRTGVVLLPRWRVPIVESPRYAVADDLRRAIDWGHFLFGASSFAVYERADHTSPRFITLRVTEALHKSDF